MKLLKSSYLILSMVFTVQLLLHAQNSAKKTENMPGNSHQFDFWIGKWNVNNHFLQDDHTWKDEGSAVDYVYSVLDGKGIMEFWDGTGRNGKIIEGFSLRYFNKKDNEWELALNWPQKDNGFFFFLKGSFRHRRGEFNLSFTNSKGQYTMSRYTFSDISKNSLRWNDGTSTDSGMTWRTNWIMEFTRESNNVTWPSVDENFPTYNNNSFCDLPECSRFYNLTGKWQGKLTMMEDGSAREIPAEIESWKVLNGAAVMLFIKSLDEKNNFKDFLMFTYRKLNDGFLLLTMNNKQNTGYRVYFWKPTQNMPEFHEYTRWRQKEELQKLTIDKYSDSEFNFTKYSGNGNKIISGTFKKIK